MELHCFREVARGLYRRARPIAPRVIASGASDFRNDTNGSVNSAEAPDNVLAFLNRLSDLLFALARVADQQSGRADRMLGG